MMSPSRTQPQKEARAISAVGEVVGAQSPVAAPAGQVFIELGRGQSASQKRGNSHADQGKHNQGDKEGQDAGQDGDQQRKDAVERLMERFGHMVPDRGVVGVQGLRGLVRVWQEHGGKNVLHGTHSLNRRSCLPLETGWTAGLLMD